MSRCLPLFAAVLGTVAYAQSDRGRISGRVLDPSGAAVARAVVVVQNPSTDLKRETVTEPEGIYLVDSLLSATYKVTASAPGFATAVVEDLPLSVGQSRTLDIRLQPANVQESITVASGALAEVETSSASIGANVSTREVSNLPLNGRLLSQLYLLVPGASSSGAGTFNDMRFAGRANEQNTVRYDGVQAGSIIGSNPSDATGTTATQFRLALSLENIQEFRAEASTYSAEYGRGTGGQVTIVTKSGTNSLHGNLFEYVRNSHFDARNYFNPVGTQPQAPLRLNQFGGSLGGAIRKDRLFFFISDETLFQRVYAPFSQQTLSAFARSQAVPAIQPLLAAYPLGNAGPTSSQFFDLVQRTLASSVYEFFGSARVDYHVSQRNNLYFRLGREEGDSFEPNDASGSGRSILQRAQNGIVDFTTVLAPTMINDLKAGLNLYRSRSLLQGVMLPGLDLSNVLITIGGAAQAGATGIVTPTGAGSTPITQGSPYTNSEYTFVDNLSWSRGAHNIKAGIEYNPRTLYMDQLGATAYTFTSVQSFLANNPSQVNVTNTVSSPSVFHNGVTGVRKGVQWFLGGFFQDEWKIKPNFTINAGLRYDYFSPLFEDRDLIVSVDTYTGQINTSGYPGFTTSKLNFAPRLGFAWSPQKFNNKTVLRIGAGYYYGPGQGEDQNQQILNDTVAIQLTSGISYPVNPAALIRSFDPNNPNAGFTPRVYAHGYHLPEKVLSYSASIQQTLPDQSVLTVAYVGSQGRNMFQRTISNLITGVATDPNNGNAIITRQFGNRFGEFDVKTSFGNNHYDSLQVGLNHRFARGLTASAQYSLSHNIGTSAGSNEATTAENNYSFAQERGDNSFDIRQVLTGSALYQLPVGRGRRFGFGGSALAENILGGWQLGGSLNVRTGLPINVLMQRNNVLYLNPATGVYTTSPVLSSGVPVTAAVANLLGGGQSRGTQRPDLVPGIDPYVDPASGFWLNPAAFAVPKPGTFGNLARNALRGPGFAQLDATISKQFSITERWRLDLRCEFYNLLNHPNWANPTANLGGGIPSSPTGTGIQPGQPFTKAIATSTFSQLNATVGRYVNNGTNRQIQLALRISF